MTTILKHKIIETENPLDAEEETLKQAVVIPNDIFTLDDLVIEIYQKNNISLDKCRKIVNLFFNIVNIGDSYKMEDFRTVN